VYGFLLDKTCFSQGDPQPRNAVFLRRKTHSAEATGIVLPLRGGTPKRDADSRAIGEAKGLAGAEGPSIFRHEDILFGLHAFSEKPLRWEEAEPDQKVITILDQNIFLLQHCSLFVTSSGMSCSRPHVCGMWSRSPRRPPDASE
jgi:hypothetical protein